MPRCMYVRGIRSIAMVKWRVCGSDEKTAKSEKFGAFGVIARDTLDGGRCPIVTASWWPHALLPFGRF